jgi:hypothetical protein
MPFFRVIERKLISGVSTATHDSLAEVSVIGCLALKPAPVGDCGSRLEAGARLNEGKCALLKRDICTFRQGRVNTLPKSLNNISSVELNSIITKS